MPAPRSGSRIAAQLGVLLTRSTRQTLYQRLVDEVDGVDVATYPVISGLARTGPTTATRLAATIGVDRSATTRYASKLEAAGLISRTVDPEDARATQLALTPAGEHAVAVMRGQLAAAIDDAVSTWPAGDALAFATLLERFTDSLVDASRAPAGP